MALNVWCDKRKHRGDTLIKAANSQEVEYPKFISANAEAKKRRDQHRAHVRADSAITLVRNGATVIILWWAADLVSTEDALEISRPLTLTLHC